MARHSAFFFFLDKLARHRSRSTPIAPPPSLFLTGLLFFFSMQISLSYVSTSNSVPRSLLPQTSSFRSIACTFCCFEIPRASTSTVEKEKMKKTKETLTFKVGRKGNRKKKKKFNKREKTFQRNGYVIADDPKEARERLSVWYKEMIRTLKNKKEKWRGKWKKISNLDWVREARLLLAPGLTLRRLWRTGRRCRSRPDE